ncbi:ribonuclease T2-A-like isoform X2 [Xenopus laevis]|uniref:Uncharacterized protein n=2 Tax=Xenopus laevis TaxID=8355 RepID=A0A974HHF5_XENLA|nr:ribonuclease T2-A-like isoform X2 [Xenopus laevis]OCT78065.1 hypothetical protein XELAEV_18029163mg [Xenopus laevis]
MRCNIQVHLLLNLPLYANYPSLALLRMADCTITCATLQAFGNLRIFMNMLSPDVSTSADDRRTAMKAALTNLQRRHEWQKHGTCAASLECLNTQLKYFSKGLELYKQVDLNSVLEKSGIIPSTSYYQMKDIENALKGFYGVVPKIQCLSPRQGETVQTLGQIEICFTKEFQLRNCTESVDNLNDALTAWKSYNEDLHVCDTSANTLYPPVKEHSK